MFGAASAGRYFEMKSRASKLPKASVTEKEFIQACIDNGMTEEKAKSTAKISKIMGSQVMVGDRMLEIVTKKKK